MNRFLCLTSLILLVFLAGFSLAGIPKMINYQGMLTDNSGTPLSGPYNLTFKIWTDTTGGSSLWDETHAVSVQNGLYNVILGRMTALNLPFDQPYWLEVQVGAETMPRFRFTSVGYAYRAQNADTADYARGGVGGSGSPWIFRISDGSDTTITTGGGWGVARFGNVLFGNADSTHVNLGVACTTGTNGSNRKYCTVGGGSFNTASGGTATVGGGNQNTASGGTATVGGGEYNTASGNWATVGGGEYNTASGGNATVGGGYVNTASGNWATVGGGYINTASGGTATVGGGSENAASGSYATVGGGDENAASGRWATVGGGYINTASGDYSTIPGGDRDTLTSSGEYSMIFGRGVYVNNAYKVVFFDGDHSGCLGINRDDRNGGISYPIHVGTNSSNGNGAYLTGGGVWTPGSSRTFKENFQKLNNLELLEKISSLSVEAWNYKDSDERHIGPFAEEFVSAFDVGVIREDGVRDNKYLSTEDIAGVALAGVKELINENQELKQTIEKLSQRIAELEKSR